MATDGLKIKLDPKEAKVGPLVPVTPLIGQLTIFRIIKSIKKIVVFSQTMMVFKDCVK